MSRTAVVILNYNGETLLPRFLPSVLLHSEGAEIIVADNGSTDGSVALLRQSFPQVRLVILDNNYGFCGGYNRALAHVQADVYVLLNSDIEVTPRWLSPLEELLQTRPEIAAVQPKILSYNKKDTFEHAGAGGGLIDALGYPFCRGRVFDSVEQDTGQYNDTTEVFWASGACLAIRANLFHQLGGFDEDFFAHMEEIDLCWKLNRARHKVYYCGQSTIYHLGAGTLGYNSPRKTYLNFRNGLSLIFKHLNPGELLVKLPLRMMLDWLAAVVFLLKGQAGNFNAVGKAHLHFVLHIGRDRRKRRLLRAIYPAYSKTSVFPGSVVFSYYMKGKRKIG
ncbi:glycosyltransferase family 2 protein [Chryseolinea lacunae]|uniref:Glycosyltransferase family 2 protein n=1 Tax=Chryseolinea lacunae TaxID=2801331 RepID=A0ABS1KTX0_9BACT|nr:glycosyltransferase family 2 protein [Chryseolinea lacunae]MBL0742900.1 glycosyltransferase family 2 protein [Chryseolinea lacunae]